MKTTPTNTEGGGSREAAMRKGVLTVSPKPKARSRSASERATRAVRKGQLLTAETPKERSPKQENL
jgi:hypothetical protein